MSIHPCTIETCWPVTRIEFARFPNDSVFPNRWMRLGVGALESPRSKTLRKHEASWSIFQQSQRGAIHGGLGCPLSIHLGTKNPSLCDSWLKHLIYTLRVDPVTLRKASNSNCQERAISDRQAFHFHFATPRPVASAVAIWKASADAAASLERIGGQLGIQKDILSTGYSWCSQLR